MAILTLRDARWRLGWYLSQRNDVARPTHRMYDVISEQPARARGMPSGCTFAKAMSQLQVYMTFDKMLEADGQRWGHQ
jgi:hypothetical protein